MRDLCVFARHDLAKDPPFSRLDLISCRNVLIYMGPALQKRVLSTFQYALKPGGFLFLGNSESISDYSGAFTAEDRRHRIFLRKPAAAASRELRLGRGLPARAGRRAAQRVSLRPVRRSISGRKRRRSCWSTIRRPPLIVDPDLHIVHFQGDISPYLAPATGQPSFHLLKMVRPELVVDLRTAIYKARKEGVAAHKDGVPFEHEAGPPRCGWKCGRSRSAHGKKQDLLVVFQKAEPAEPRRQAGRPPARDTLSKKPKDWNGNWPPPASTCAP